MQHQSGSFSSFRTNPPLIAGLTAATLLFLLFAFGVLNGLSANTDHPYLGYDFFGLPRCGLAVRFGTNPFTASADYPFYGPWATPWVTGPTLCIAAVPLSYLSPGMAFGLFDSLNFLLHIAIIAFFGLRLASIARSSGRRDQIRDCVFFGLLGLFLPWYVLYYEGQFHSIVVAALALVLVRPDRPALGFIISAVSKPVLGPAGLVLIVRRRWSAIEKIALGLALGVLPWMLLKYNVAIGLHFGQSKDYSFFLQNSASSTKFSTYRWNQQISLSAALDEWMPVARHLYIRYALAAASIFASVYLFRRKRFEVAIITSMLWFFFLYGRGHEYQLTLYVPMLACLYSLKEGRYRNWFMVLITLLLALPTSYPLYHLFYGLSNPNILSNQLMLKTNPALYYLFLWQKPICAFLLFGMLLVREWPYVVIPSLGSLQATQQRLRAAVIAAPASAGGTGPPNEEMGSANGDLGSVELDRNGTSMPAERQAQEARPRRRR